MKHEQRFLQRIADGMELAGEPLPGESLVEISGERRVLIENHRGMTQYSREKICVKVSFGAVAVLGCGLELTQMTRDRLVISGTIDTVSILRRKCK